MSRSTTTLVRAAICSVTAVLALSACSSSDKPASGTEPTKAAAAKVSPPAILQAGTLKICAPNDGTPPNVYHDASGELVGSEVDLGKALSTACDQLSERIDEAGAVVTHDDLPVVRGEEALLVQLFQNLVGNAVKFRHPDRAPQVHLSARRVDEGWELECRDNGIGIDPQYAERVFVIFQRLHAKDLYEGTGIGLALCKKIVEFHGGRIWIPETTGDGTSICWTLPVQEDVAPADGDDDDRPAERAQEMELT